jgi:hypothetical protein
MKYEIWEISKFGEGDFFPSFLNSTFEDFMDAYFEFQKLIKIKPCCIILKK